MKIAAISDIHGNVFALQAVIADIRRRGVDSVVNLGDILYGPLAPRATYNLLMEYDFVTIRGNQDRQIYEATAEQVETNPTMGFILEDLGPEPVEWMKSLPFDKQLTSDIYLCHGTPANDLVYLLENVEAGYARLRQEEEILERLEGQTSAIILCGHTHTSRTVALSGGQLIVNPGSVGLPAYTDNEPVVHSMESFSPHAAYAIVEKGKAGWTIQHIKVPYDFQRAAREAQKRQREDWVHFLTTGRGLS